MTQPSDPRDYTPEPPAYLDPRWVLDMRKRLQEAAKAGFPAREWPYRWNDK